MAAVSTVPFKIMSRSPKVAQAAVAMSIPFQHSFRQTDDGPPETDCNRICSRELGEAVRLARSTVVDGRSVVGWLVKTITISLPSSFEFAA